tara:strand:- start:271 stop:1044 length:774 start_codon:yes stop_codon:yes gene_type:complete
MKIDWIIPIGKNEKHTHVKECLASLMSIMSMKEDRLIVVCKREQWINYQISSNNIILIDPPTIKNAAAYRNKALNVTSADFIAFQDVDDISLKIRRKKIVKSSKKYDLIVGNYFSINEESKKIGLRKLSTSNDLFFFRNNIPLPALAVRSSAVGSLRFDEDLIVGEDNVFISKLLNKNLNVKRSTEPIISYRITDNKNLKRQGLKGIIGEWNYRKKMLNGSSLKRKLLILFGMLTVIFVKLLPSPIFKKLYKYSHSG